MTRIHAPAPGEELRALLAQAANLRQRVSQTAGRSEGDAAPEPVHPTFADRLEASVIRPLTEALHRLGEFPPHEHEGNDVQRADSGASIDEALWRLTKEVTRLRMLPTAATQVLEAAAGLQDLACESVSADGLTERLRALEEIQSGLEPVVQASINGPYLVAGVDRMTNWLGEPIPTRPQMALCRCGASARKPFCDGTHARIGFASGKDPNRVADRRDT